MCGQSIVYNIYATLANTNPQFMGFSSYQNVLKEIIFRKREYQEYITPQDFGSEVFLYARHGRALEGESP